jgi:hypothetical protein
MGRTFDTIDEHLAAWIGRQVLFFVASAPLDADGHVNVSPKGPIGSLRVLGPATSRRSRRRVVRVDVTRIADSCGYGVPLMAYEGERPHNALSARKRLRTGGAEAIAGYIAERNARSIDGLPAVDPAA